MTRRIPITLAAGLLAVVAPDAFAVKFGDPKAGEEKAQACAACHGVDNDNPQFPRIAGQHADYLLHALKAYKNGDRQNAIMQGQVSGLSVEDMKDLAAYYASLESDLKTLELE
jgi:cytochrome c553